MSPPLHPPRLRPASRLAVAVTVVLLGAGCGGSSDAPDVASLASGKGGADKSAAARPDPETAARTFARCMRKNGVDMPDPKSGEDGMIVIEGPPGGALGGPPPGGPPVAPPGDGKPVDVLPKGVDGEKFARAEKACRKHLGDVNGGLSREDQTKMQDAAVAYARCMRTNGYDMPDPDFSEAGSAVELPLDPHNPAFRKAHEACKDKLGQPTLERGGHR